MRGSLAKPTVPSKASDRWRHRGEPTPRPQLPAKIEEFVLRAPIVLNFGPPEVIDALLFFFDELRFRVMNLRQRVIVDLRACTNIGPVGVLLLAAEVSRCNHARPDSVTGYSPMHHGARAMLSVFGFFKAAGMEGDIVEVAPQGYVQIQTGVGQSDDLAAQLGKVASLTEALWGDQAFADRIHGALNEAMTNVLMHAYDPELMSGSDACESGRWWVAGFSNESQDHAWFMALDLGVGIPVSAPAKNKDLRAYLTRPMVRNDAAILSALVRDDSRSRTGLPQHGKGIPTMISVIRDRASQGTLWIVSGLGLYILDKDTSRPPRARIIEVSQPLTARAAGTLILWKVGRPTIKETQGS